MVVENYFRGGILDNREPIVNSGSLKWNSRDTNDLSKLRICKPFNGYIDEVAIYGQALAHRSASSLGEDYLELSPDAKACYLLTR